jgi:CheY-like chemotaxis protein
MANAHPPRKRILIVEDDFLAQELMSLLLGSAGFCVAVAPNGEEAIKRLHTSEPPHLILLDLRMPVMDGWQFREAMKRDERLASIPVLIVSVADQTGEQTAALEATGFLHKPVDTAQLLLMVQKCCGEEMETCSGDGALI